MKTRPVPQNASRFLELLYHPDEVRAAEERLKGSATGAAWTEVRVLVLADASGSMAPWQSQMRDGLGRFLQELAAGEVPFQVNLVGFNHEHRVLASAMDYATGGDTAVWDAMRWALSGDEGPGPVLLLIASDGEDNRSQPSACEEVRGLIGRRRRQGNWSLLWLNMSGLVNSAARNLEIECLDFSRADIVPVLADMARRLSRAAYQLRLAGGRRLPPLLGDS